MLEERQIELTCKKCQFKWFYKGKRRHTNCPKCRANVVTGLLVNELTKTQLEQIDSELEFEREIQFRQSLKEMDQGVD